MRKVVLLIHRDVAGQTDQGKSVTQYVSQGICDGVEIALGSDSDVLTSIHNRSIP